MKDTTEQEIPSAMTVEQRHPQDGEIRVRWAWVEATAWLERMLKALETGLGGGRWFRLIDKVWSENNLRSVLRKVVAKGGSAVVDGRSVSAVERQSEEEIAEV